jgi:nucleoside-diphosphate-sugar epimerase
MAGRKLLLTGASGFTGRYLLKSAVALGYECIAISQKGTLPIESAANVIECDLLDFDKVKQIVAEIEPDYVVHLAAISYVGHGSTKDISQTNIVGTTNLLDAIAKQCTDIQKILIVSSGNVYGNAISLPITERSVFNPENDYGVSKCSMELAVKIRMDSLPIVITRPFNYTGIGQAEHFLVPKIVRAFKSGQTHIELGNLDVARDFSDVRDVVAAYLGLLESEAQSEVYNVCSGKSVSLLNIIDKLNALAGYEINVKVNPEFIRSNEIKELYGCENKLRALIGPYRKYTFEDTLNWIFNDYGCPINQYK